MTPILTNDVQSFWLNYTQVNEKLEDANLVEGSVPRWVLLGRVVNSVTGRNTSSAFLVIDSEKESVFVFVAIYCRQLDWVEDGTILLWEKMKFTSLLLC